ncbi:hypothetical protein A9K97_gp447 [Tokyovirus A1]|uniref:hypothetical protein n=1 Tax=Tokyovirus A1 TaxID=1826170 RepID=UPI0007A98E7A|nr:hypothetical protein A9K97_gp447 [Tokyovirus A1]BAU79904.1 hypothetical protein [Tokyovirus A1]
MSSPFPEIHKILLEGLGIRREEFLASEENLRGERLVHISIPKYGASVSWYEPLSGTDTIVEVAQCLKKRVLESTKFKEEQHLNTSRIFLLEEEVKELKEAVKALSEKILEFEYAPGGIKAEEAKKNFERLSRKQT